MTSTASEYVVFGQEIVVVEEAGAYRACLSASPERAWGKGSCALAAIGDCVLRWSRLEAEQQDDSEDAAEQETRMTSTRTYQSVQPRLSIPSVKRRAVERKPAHKTQEPATASYSIEERVVFGQRVIARRETRDRCMAQIEGRSRMWWGHGRTPQAALADCLLNWSGMLMRLPDDLDSHEAEFSLLSQSFTVTGVGDGYTARLTQLPAVFGRGASPAEALAACLIRWSDLQGVPGTPVPANIPGQP